MICLAKNISNLGGSLDRTFRQCKSVEKSIWKFEWLVGVPGDKAFRSCPDGSQAVKAGRHNCGVRFGGEDVIRID